MLAATAAMGRSRPRACCSRCSPWPIRNAGRSQSGDAPPAAPEAPPQPSGIRYQVAFEGVSDNALRSLLQQVSETERLIDRPPPSLARLRRRAEDDRQRLLDVLRSEGYYGGQVQVAMDSGAQPVSVTFRIDLGPVYRFGSLSIEAEPPEPALTVPSVQEIGLKTGEPAAARTILDAEQALLEPRAGPGLHPGPARHAACGGRPRHRHDGPDAARRAGPAVALRPGRPSMA